MYFFGKVYILNKDDNSISSKAQNPILFCMMTVWPTVKINWILDAKNNGKSYFDTVIQKKFENLTKSIKDKRKYVKYKNSQKPTKRQSDCHGCFINGYALW